MLYAGISKISYCPLGISEYFLLPKMLHRIRKNAENGNYILYHYQKNTIFGPTNSILYYVLFLFFGRAVRNRLHQLFAHIPIYIVISWNNNNPTLIAIKIVIY